MYSLFVLGLLLLCLGGASEAIMDKIMFHYDRSIFKSLKNQIFFDPNLSWRNKYKKNQLIPKFPGSTTIFVSLTDMWHLAKLAKHLFTFGGLFILAFNSVTNWELFSVFVVGRILYGLSFELTFSKLLEK